LNKKLEKDITGTMIPRLDGVTALDIYAKKQ
jgi:hypothetical protein